MGDLIAAVVLAWAIIFVWWGTNLLLRADRRGRKLIGGIMIGLALVPTVVAMWLGT